MLEGAAGRAGLDLALARARCGLCSICSSSSHPHHRARPAAREKSSMIVSSRMKKNEGREEGLLRGCLSDFDVVRSAAGCIASEARLALLLLILSTAEVKK